MNSTPNARFAPDLAMHIECRPSPYQGEMDATSCRRPGSRVIAPVYDNGRLDHYTAGCVASYDEIDRLVTVFYDTPQASGTGDRTHGVMAFPVSLGKPAGGADAPTMSEMTT